MRIFLFFLVLSITTNIHSQNLTGIWRGHFISDQATRLQLQGIDDRYKFEVQLGQKDKLFQGVTYSYKTTVFYGKASCYGAVNNKTKKVFLEETKILEVKTASGGACIMTCFLQYSKMGDEEVLEGHYTSMSTADSSQCGKGTVYLRKVETSDFYKEPFLANKEKPKAPATRINPAAPPLAKKFTQSTAPVTPAKPVTPPKPAAPKTKATEPARPKPQQPVVVGPKKSEVLKTIPDDSVKKMTGKISSNVVVPRVLATRQNELVRTITTAAKDISIKIYDNGSIDNDTVSVYVDKKLVVANARLTEKAIVVNLTLDDSNDEHELVMVAENLGEIPPNTSLMVVTAGDQQYEVRITSTEQKNAVVLFKYEPAK